MATTYVYRDSVKYYHRVPFVPQVRMTLAAAKRAGLLPCPTCWPAATAAASPFPTASAPSSDASPGPSPETTTMPSEQRENEGAPNSIPFTLGGSQFTVGSLPVTPATGASPS